MRSIKTKGFSLILAGSMLLALAGCNMSAPSTVGNIGGVEIPSGLYLLMQYNAYNTAASKATLPEGKKSSDVSAVLKAECTGTIGDEEVTATGAEYIQKLTDRSVEYYAAVEKTFAELGGELDADTLDSVTTNADSMWESNGKLYEANGIGRSTVENYLLNAQKAKKILEMTYGENGTTPVTESEYKNYIADNCYYIESVQLPLINYTSYTAATEEQKTAIEEIAETCRKDLSEKTLGEGAAASQVYTAAMTYAPQAMQAMGGTMESSQAVYYGASQLFTPSALSGYANSEDGTNKLTDPLDAAQPGEWITIDLGSSILVARRLDPLSTGASVSDLVKGYDLLTAMKSGDMQNEMYAAGAALEHNLDASAIKTYAASKIKKNV